MMDQKPRHHRKNKGITQYWEIDSLLIWPAFQIASGVKSKWQFGI